MNPYIWQSESWPHLTWDNDQLIEPLSRCRLLQGKLLGRLASIDREMGQEAYAELLVEEAVQTASIEGQMLDRNSVRSSVVRRLGLDAGGLPLPERHADGLVDVLIDATENHDTPLTPERLKAWQAAMFPTGYSGLHRIITGDWRGPDTMQIVSGPVGQEKIHYEAPPRDRIEKEMTEFIDWWQKSFKTCEGILRAGIAHFRFVTIHPFEDGNGRIARAITDMAMAQDESLRQRFYSLSAQIVAERDAYYAILEKTQKGNGDITRWLAWFLRCFSGAIRKSEQTLHKVFAKSAFWKIHVQTILNGRQQKVINKLLDAGKDGFEGGLTTRKYVSMAKTGRATAQREIRDLVEKKVLIANPGGGRSTNYDLIWPDI
jgi:Fic family protein